ncbi:hypothetical protein OO015_13415 [Thermomicrobium sp. 4228-Ro]|uniref:hypothetical protein n=1 Tax=Thermomicrobium sp. 4228-Ro TaxID=2993937 RepID=UPI0022496A72|nr:hypothetical protein [Thermomicrobium sp. 4228-Ro]MCX2728483.1 hypothetical protein [Thermomicrobium sp. 4228-Ro]
MLRRLVGRGDEETPRERQQAEPGGTRPEQEQVQSASGEVLVYRYEDILRAVGRFIDEQELQDVVIMQTEHGVFVRGIQRPRVGQRVTPRFCERLFTKAEIAAILEEGRRRRGTGSKLFQ